MLHLLPQLGFVLRYALTLFVLLAAVSLPAQAQPERSRLTRPNPPSPQVLAREYFYFDPDGLGAHAFYNPQNFIVQGGLGALYDQRIDEFDWLGGFHTVNTSVFNPIDAVSEYGWGRFFYREFLPHLGEGQNYVPNWVWHFTGGGMRTKLMQEFYEHHGFRHARALAWLTMYSYHYLNEAVQAERFRAHDRATVDAVADLYFFDWWGGLFFQFDAVNRFMSRTLHMREWSFQAQFDPRHLRLMNNGQLYWLRLHLYSALSLSFLTGEQITSLNLTFEWSGHRQISAGAGPKSKAFIARKNGDTDPSGIVFSAGVYYSVRDNPFIVLTFEPGERHGKNTPAEDVANGKYLLNVYPGVFELFEQPLAVSLGYQRETLYVGMGVGMLPLGVVAATR